MAFTTTITTRESWNTLNNDGRTTARVGSAMGVGESFDVYWIDGTPTGSYAILVMPEGTPDAAATCAEVKDCPTVVVGTGKFDDLHAFRAAMHHATQLAIESLEVNY